MPRSEPRRTLLERIPWLPLVVGVIVALLMLVGGGVAFGQADGFGLSVRDTVLDPDGRTEVVVNLTGGAAGQQIPADAFAVTEEGDDVAGLEVTQLFEDGAVVDVVVALAIDVSGSMAGEPMELTKDGALGLVEALTPLGIRIQLLTFAGSVDVVTEPTDDLALLTAAIEALEASGETALYDAIGTAIDGLLVTDAQPNLVVFSDGEDNASVLSREDAIAMASGPEIPINIVALESESFSADAVEQLALETGGRTLAATEAGELKDAFQQISDDLTSQYRLTYVSEEFASEDLELAVAVTYQGESQSVSYVVPNTRDPAAQRADVLPPERRVAAPSAFSGDDALLAGTLAAFLAMLLVFALMFTGQRTKADRILGDQLARYLDGGDHRAGRSGLVAAHFRDRAMELLEAAPAPEGFSDKLTARLEQAAWPLRNGEFLALVLLAAVAPAALASALFNPLGGVLLGVLTGAIPIVVLENRRAKRQDAFLRALPDTLQLMAGSLRAGYGVLQAIDTVSKESSGPTAEEFNRVLTEARLGMPIEDALEAMAERIGSMDLRWVVLAINIQREVGGNLAELLDTVSEVLREREMLRRQIKVLSAEGRLSAIILILLPIFLATYLILVRPEYVAVLIQSGLIGYAMVVGAVVLMLGGIVWIRNLIRIEV